MLVDGQHVLATPEDHDSPAAENIFADNLWKITHVASTALNNTARIGTIAMPHHFNDTSYSSIFRSAVQVDPILDRQPWNVRRLWMMVAQGYSDAYCTAPRTTRPSDDELTKYVLVVNYDLDRIDIIAGEVSDMGPTFHGKTSIYDVRLLGFPPHVVC